MAASILKGVHANSRVYLTQVPLVKLGGIPASVFWKHGLPGVGQHSRILIPQRSSSSGNARRIVKSKHVIGVSSVIVGYVLYRQIRPKSEKLAKNWQVSLYRKMPLNAMSRIWGKINEKELPESFRKPLLGLYVWMFGVDLNEAADENLKNYKNLGEFFRRQLKPEVRSIDIEHSLISPSDGKVLHYGVVENGILEQVKGVTYSLKGFLGPPSWTDDVLEAKSLSEEEYNKTFNIKPGNRMYHCVIYLAPGDYHRFHSPTDWTIKYRRHFPGELLSVNPGIARWLQGLFSLNERVVYTGHWIHGFFAYVPVGATNVGSIRIYRDSDLVTNTGHKTKESFYDKSMCTGDSEGLKVTKGEMFGEFNLGSTIVVIFEAPEDFTFRVHNNQKVKFGQALGTCS